MGVEFFIMKEITRVKDDSAVLEKNRKILTDLIDNCNDLCRPDVIKQSQKLDKLIVKVIRKDLI